MTSFVLRADASSRIGMGHVARLSALGAALVARGATCVLASRDASTEVAAFIARAGLTLARLATDSPEEVVALAKSADPSGHPKLVAIDRYDIDASYIQSIRGSGCFALYVDDTGTDVASAADLVVNQNFFAAEIAYPQGLRVLRGPQYALLRPEFAALRETTRVPQDAVRVLVTMGGADVTGLTGRIVDAIALLGRNVIADVVIGAAHPDPSAVHAHVKKLPRAIFTVNASDMASRMAAADVVVTTAGSTCLEIACLGRRALAFAVADNQRPVADALLRAGLMRVGNAEDDAREVARVLSSLLDEDGSTAIAAQRGLVDGRGSERVASELLAAVAPA